MPNIIPGAGWLGATSDPGPQGSPASVGYNAKAIARWNVVPYQTFNGAFNVGVVAFHREGINRVEFSANNGAWVASTSATLNNTTGVVEFWATINASDYSPYDLPEIRAVVYPNVGECLVLGGPLNETNLISGHHSMYLTANPGSTLHALAYYVAASGGSDANDGLTASTPFATSNRAAFVMSEAAELLSPAGQNAGGGTIYLLAGTHTLTGAAFDTGSWADKRWMTVKPAPGLTKAEVTIAGSQALSSGFNSPLVCFEDVTFSGAAPLRSGTAGGAVDLFWFKNCKFLGAFGIVDVTSWYVTDDCVYEDVDNGTGGARIVRDTLIDGVATDAFSGAGLIINSEVRNPVAGVGAHPDIYQGVTAADNIILYGVTANVGMPGGTDQQCFQFNVPPTNIAVVNCNMEPDTDWSGPVSNIFHKNCTLAANFGALTATNMVFEDVAFLGTPPPNPYPGVTYRSDSATANPVISPSGGSYEGTQVIEMYSDTEGATIRYTLDGTDPTEVTGEVYSFPIGISEDTEVRAVAYRSGLTISEITSETYDITTPTLPPEVSAGQLNATIIRLVG